MKRNPIVVVRDDNEKRRKGLVRLIRNTINSSPLAMGLRGALFDPGADLHFIGNGNGSSSAVYSLLERLQKKQPKSRKVLVVDSPPSEDNMRLYSQQLVNDILYAPNEETALTSLQRFFQPTEKPLIGFFGFGRLFQMAFPLVRETADVSLFSQHLSAENYNQVGKWLEQNKKSISFESSAANLVRKKPLAIILANAPHVSPDRNKCTPVSLDAINKVLPELSEYVANGGVVVNMNNVPGPGNLALLEYITEHGYGGPELATRITGFTADSARARSLLATEIWGGKIDLGKIDLGDLKVPLYLEHGDCIMHPEEARYAQVKLADLYPMLKNPQVKTSLNRILASMGKEAYVAATDTGSGFHYGTGDAILRGITEITEGKPFTDAVYCYYTRDEIVDISNKPEIRNYLHEHGAFMLSPAVYHASKGITPDLEFHLKNVGDGVITSELVSQAYSQNQAIESWRGKKIIKFPGSRKAA